MPFERCACMHCARGCLEGIGILFSGLSFAAFACLPGNGSAAKA